MAIPPIDLLLERAEEKGCLTLSELSELVEEHDLSDTHAQALADRLEARIISTVRTRRRELAVLRARPRVATVVAVGTATIAAAIPPSPLTTRTRSWPC